MVEPFEGHNKSTGQPDLMDLALRKPTAANLSVLFFENLIMLFTLKGVIVRKLIVISLFLALAEGITLAEVDLSEERIRPLFDAIWEAESSKSENMTSEDSTEAGEWGPYQIRQIYYDDVIRIKPSVSKEIKRKDCWDKAKSEALMLIYWGHYAKEGTFEELAKLHHCGPSWKKYKKNADKYWTKIERILDAAEQD